MSGTDYCLRLPWNGLRGPLVSVTRWGPGVFTPEGERLWQLRQPRRFLTWTSGVLDLEGRRAFTVVRRRLFFELCGSRHEIRREGELVGTAQTMRGEVRIGQLPLVKVSAINWFSTRYMAIDADGVSVASVDLARQRFHVTDLHLTIWQQEYNIPEVLIALAVTIDDMACSG